MENKQLYDFLKGLWDEGTDKSKDIKKFYQYWNGDLDTVDNAKFQDQTKSSDNICKEISESKLANMLDAQFSVAVTPEYRSMADFKTIKDQQAYADILNDELNNVLQANRFDHHKEVVGRWGMIGGFGAGQTTFTTDERVEGEIKIDALDPKDNPIRWNKGAKKQDELTWIGYRTELNPAIVKRRYARQADGKWDMDLCKKIDEITTQSSTTEKGDRKGVVAISSSEATDLAYVFDERGITAGKIVKLIVMFLLDDSLSAPEQKDDAEQTEEKKILKAKYPNGRAIIFSDNEKNKMILSDKAAPEGFKSLGNIDFFSPMDFSELTGKGEIEDLKGLQDRINGGYLKMRVSVANHIRTIAMDADLDAERSDTDLVNHPVTKFEGIGRDQAKVPQTLSNDTLQDISTLMPYLDKLKNNAKENARVNDTMLNGARQPGTTSSDMVEDLQESPMSGIRMIQRNFKDYVIRVSEKVICLIQTYYTTQRLIKLSTGIVMKGADGKPFTVNTAKMGMRPNEKTQENERYMELYDEAGKVVKEIKSDHNWKFKVEVVAGTEIPRSRRENASLTERLYKEGTLGDPNDIDVKEQYMRSLDFPNARAFMALQRRKAQIPAQLPKMEQILANPEMAKGFGEILTGLKGFSQAKQQILKAMGLAEGTDKLDSAPVQEVTSKADVSDVSAIAPTTISDDPVKAAEGAQRAEAMEMMKSLKSEDVGEMLGFIKTKFKGGVNA